MPQTITTFLWAGGKDKTMTKWTDDMVREYFDTHWNATLHEICALSGRTKADVKRVLMEG